MAGCRDFRLVSKTGYFRLLPCVGDDFNGQGCSWRCQRCKKAKQTLSLAIRDQDGKVVAARNPLVQENLSWRSGSQGEGRIVYFHILRIRFHWATGKV